MRRRRLVITLVAAAAVAAAAAAWVATDSPLDKSRGPRWAFMTNPFSVGSTYTVGSSGVTPDDAVFPVVVTGVEVVESVGVEVIGTGVVDPAAGTGLGLVIGFPPTDPPIKIDQRAIDEGKAWDTEITTVVGIRTTAPVSGLRGILVRWRDANGNEGSRLYDLGVITCAPDACDAEQRDSAILVLEQLNLIDR